MGIFEEFLEEDFDEVYWNTKHTIYKWIVPWEKEATTPPNQE